MEMPFRLRGVPGMTLETDAVSVEFFFDFICPAATFENQRISKKLIFINSRNTKVKFLISQNPTTNQKPGFYLRSSLPSPQIFNRSSQPVSPGKFENRNRNIGPPPNSFCRLEYSRLQ